MKRVVILLIFVVFLSYEKAFCAVEPEVIDGMIQNDFILDEMLPNPNVYLYGTDSNGYPILLMDFSSTIPFFAIEDNYRILPTIGRYCSLFRKKVSHLQFFSLYLKIEPTCICENKGFNYKIVKLQCDEKSQTISHDDTNQYTAHAQPEYSNTGSSYKIGYLEGQWTRKQTYAEDRPIIAYSGVGSDTLKIMLKRGKKYKIPSGHIDVAMVVIAIPNYTNCACNGYVNDFIKSNCNCTKNARRICFGKTYLDNRIKNYYEVDSFHNPHGIDISSEVIKGSRINNSSIISKKETVITKRTDSISNIIPAKESKADNSAVAPQSGTVITTTKQSKDLILDDSMIMYDNIFNKQIPNTYSLYSSSTSLTNFNANEFKPK